jgi:hypothetical protein
MEIHELAMIFPPMQAEEYDATKQSIAEHGLQSPIVTFENKILDGRNRYLIIEELKEFGTSIEPQFVPFQGDYLAALDFVLNANIHRRHLTTTQKACLALELKKLRDKAAQRGGDRRSEDFQKRKNAGLKAQRPACDIAAKIIGVSPRTIQKVQAIEHQNPFLLGAMKDGGLSISEAERELRREQRANDQEQRRRTMQDKVDESRLSFHCGNGPPLLSNLESKSVRLLLIDLPVPHAGDQQHDEFTNDDALKLLDATLAAAANAMQDDCHVLLFAPVELEPAYRAALAEAGYDFRTLLVWEMERPVKGDPDGFKQHATFIIHASRGHAIVEPRISNVLTFKRVKSPTCEGEKPTLLMQALIECTSVPGEVVADPFAGSGAAGEAALKAGRRYFGVEVDPAVYSQSLTRLEIAAAKPLPDAEIVEDLVDSPPGDVEMLQDHPNGLDGDKPCYEMPVSVEPSTPVQLTGAKTAKGAKLNGRASDNRNQQAVSPIVIEDQEPLQQPFEAPQLCTVTNDAKRAEVNEIRAQIIRRASLCQEADCSCEADTNTGSCVHCPLCQRWSLSVSVRLDGSLSIICMATNDKYGQRH